MRFDWNTGDVFWLGNNFTIPLLWCSSLSLFTSFIRLVISCLGCLLGVRGGSGLTGGRLIYIDGGVTLEWVSAPH